MSRYDEVASLCLRKGFFIPSAEIYGGLAGFYDYGHNGARLKRKWEDLWIRYFLSLGDNYHLIDTTNVLPFDSLKASGHVDLFSDILVTCAKCKESYKADQLIEEITGTSGEGLTAEDVDRRLKERGARCPKCGGEFEPSRPFNMMFPISSGPKGENAAFLRPETAQGAYLSFKREFELLRKKLPLGLAMVGRAFRNEISPRQGTYRLREFLQAELQVFFNPSRFDEQVDFPSISDYELNVLLEEKRGKVESERLRCSELVEEHAHPRFYVYYMAKVQQFYLEALRLPKERLRFYEVGKSERAHYNKIQFDVQIHMESLGGFKEVAGVHYRTDHDLKGHEKFCGEKMSVFVDGNRFVPHVLELSFGVDRNLWALLDTFYEHNGRTILRIPAQLAPIPVGVFPLVNKDGLPERARDVYGMLRTRFDAFYDDSGSIGRRYARMDEVGTPFCVTIDYESLKKGDATLRERDSTKQKRVLVKDMIPTLQELLSGDLSFGEL